MKSCVKKIQLVPATGAPAGVQLSAQGELSVDVQNFAALENYK